MLFAKSTVLVTLFALGKVIAAAGTSTPACLLTVVGPENPGNLKAICKTNGKEIQSSIKDECGDDAKDALKYYAGVCKDAGFEVDTSSSSDSSSSTSTSDSSSSTSGSSTSTGGTSSTGGSDSSSGSGSNSDSSSDSASATDSADETTPTNGASTDKQVSGTALAAVVFLGFAATL
ncbi:hypothetical protein ASPVEDRAFT_43230 [Aspergillus versicolor CBS 583.65]|uniref:Extracellular membrane protein CFEM domain-containing protein n=1 Tax=Aspergillus versicolor CBS 583.65 TaxID=1036611 RepID=A0A1L9PQF3_ASPVE|nr:uncharacterized protein ASPVEDRAFT_43230 [Aspergillus versicolor CBS 583.65]OJJ03733.1 hypothetical protein ASPVEDRAFT_43230 [Aspergillus versicolor CBS 583.65]